MSTRHSSGSSKTAYPKEMTHNRVLKSQGQFDIPNILQKRAFKLSPNEVIKKYIRIQGNNSLGMAGRALVVQLNHNPNLTFNAHLIATPATAMRGDAI
jgi:hypothetical protein